MVNFLKTLSIFYIDWASEKSFAYVLQGQHEVSTNSIKLALMAVAAKFVFMDEVGLSIYFNNSEGFQDKVLFFNSNN